MKQLIIALGFIVFTSTSFSEPPCVTCLDAVPADTERIIKIYKEMSKPIIDSVRREMDTQIQDTKARQDSLALVVDSAYQQTFKREITLFIDKWTTPSGTIKRWFWKFFLYPNGDMLFSRTIQTTTK